MKLQVGNVTCHVARFDYKGEEEILSKCLTVVVPGYQYTHAYKNKHWDGLQRFYHRNSRRFPTGFLSVVAEHFAEYDFPIDVEDSRPLANLPSQIPYAIDTKLRDYQASEILSVLHNRLAVGETTIPWVRGVLKHPTGSGKSITAIGLIETVDEPTLYLLERRRLLHQFAEQYEQFTGKKAGKIGDQICTLEKVTVASVASLVTRLGNKEVKAFLDSVGLILIDECHHVREGRYPAILQQCVKAPFRLGLSGTPLTRGDLGDFQLIGSTGDLISTLDRTPLENEGYLAKVRVKFLESESGQSFRGTYNEAYRKCIVRNDERNRKIARVAVAEVRKRQSKVLILVRFIAHGTTLQSYLSMVPGLKSVFIHGTVPSAQQAQSIRSFGEVGGVDVIIATAVLDEGVDIPVANVLINAASGMSEIKTIQRVGRIVRPKDNWQSVRVYDFMDRDNTYLLKHSLQRLRTYKSENFDVLPTKQLVS